MRRALIVGLAALALVVAGCGSSSKSSSTASAAPASTGASTSASTGASTSASTGASTSASTGASTGASTSTTGGASASAGGATTDHLSAVSGKLAFTTTSLSAKAGKVTLVMANPSSFMHGIAIQGHGSGQVVGQGGTSTVTATLKPGTYTFYCPVPGHEAAGMKGTLTVT